MRAYLLFWDFAAVYGMIQCLKTLLLGLLGMGVILPLRLRTGRKSFHSFGNADANLYWMLFLIPAACMGMSRFFYLPGVVWITAFLQSAVKPIHGKLYFAVCGVLSVHFVLCRLRMRRYLRNLSVPEEDAFLKECTRKCIRCVTAGDRCGLSTRYLTRVRIYLTEDCISPFSGGILRPYVVMPRKVWRDWEEEQRKMLLCHELVHLRSGHVLWLTLFQFLKIYWWINPLIHWCDALLREDLELVCDERCVAYGGSASGYGRTMLAVLELMREREPGGSLAFLRRDDFREVKRRMEHLAQIGQAEQVLRARRGQGMRFAAAAVLVVSAALLTSYPRYTRIKELALYDEQLRMVDYDSQVLRAAVQVRAGKLVIDPDLFGRLIADEGIQGEYVYLAFDTIMKVPGYGGGGNAGMISLADYGDILYLAADCTENRVMEFCLKYLL
ncbi:MAG: M56 family metallopeptidase [Muribaculum sp.]|nr:M56 family metallopeptidase [Muribaculum sp.]